MSKYICGAVVDIGVERESQEDYVQYREFGDNLFCVVADGEDPRKDFRSRQLLQYLIFWKH